MAEDRVPPAAPLRDLGEEDRQRYAIWATALGPVIRLHDREVDNAVIEGLWTAEFPALAALLLEGSGDEAVAEGFARALAGLPRPLPQAMADDLAADFADAYLTHGFRASPNGSVWLTEDHLERQQPMFDVRDFYAFYGITVPDWRRRSDDHIVHEMQFLSHLLALGTPASLADAALFLDRHLLPWAPDFCLRVAARAREPFYAGSTLLTRSLLLALRQDLEGTTGLVSRVEPHAWAVQEGRAERQARADEESPFVPGVAESW